MYALNYETAHLEEEMWSDEKLDELFGYLKKLLDCVENGDVIFELLKTSQELHDPFGQLWALENIRNAVVSLEKKQINQKPPIQDIAHIHVELKKEKKPEIIEKHNITGEKPLCKISEVNIYPSIKNYLLENIPDEFNIDHAAKIIKNFYEKNLKRKLRTSSYPVYARCYIRYLRSLDPPVVISDGVHNAQKKIIYKKVSDGKKSKNNDNLYYKNWTDEEDDILITYIIKRKKSYDEAIKHLPGRTKDTAMKRMYRLKQKKYCITDTVTARKNMLEKKPVDKTVEDEPVSQEIIIEKELLENNTEKYGEKFLKEELLNDETKQILEQKKTEEKFLETMDTRDIKTSQNNPFEKNTPGNILYNIAIESNWIGSKKKTPLILINRRMSNYPSDFIKSAIDEVVEKNLGEVNPNKFMIFYG